METLDSNFLRGEEPLQNMKGQFNTEAHKDVLSSKKRTVVTSRHVQA